MTTAQTELERLLTASGQVDPVDGDTLASARSTVLAEAHATTARAARVVRLRRRHRRVTTAIAATAAAGVVAVTLLSGGPNPGADVHEAGPDRDTQAPVEPAPIEPKFTTVAQVVNAAATASAALDPSEAPYWKVVTSWGCAGDPDVNGDPRPSGSTCQSTMWTGLGQPGVHEDIYGETFGLPEGTIAVEGRTLTWKQANEQTWTDAQVASMVADNDASGKTDRAPSSFYVFKNSLELLTYSPASPAIRQQLWRQLAQTEGVAFDGRDTDSLGRDGWRLTWASRDWGTQSIIIDTSTGMPLEQSDQGAGVESPNVTTIVSVGPADDAPEAEVGFAPVG